MRRKRSPLVVAVDGPVGWFRASRRCVPAGRLGEHIAFAHIAVIVETIASFVYITIAVVIIIVACLRRDLSTHATGICLIFIYLTITIVIQIVTDLFLRLWAITDFLAFYTN